MNTLTWILIAIIALEFIFSLVLNLLNVSHSKRPIPSVLSDVYPAERYQLQQAYSAETTKFSYIEKTIETAIVVAIIAVGGFGLLHEWLQDFNYSPVLTTLLFFGIIGSAAQILGIPFSIWSIFVIEERYGFNKTKPWVFIADLFKSLLLSAIIGGGLLALITWLFYSMGQWFWVLAFGVILLFSLLANALYSRVIVPLFNKQTPLEEGSLLESIKEFGARASFPVSKVFVIDGSKRSTKANAYFSGFGKNRRVVLYDTLIESMSNEEVLAVLAHEIGHYRKRHIWLNMALGSIQTGLILFLFGLLAQSPHLPQALGYQASEPVFHLSLIAFAILLSPAQTLLGLAFNYLSRAMEYQADAFAAKFNLAQPLVNGLKKLSALNLSNLTPHPAYVSFFYSHPPLYQRVKRLVG